MFGLLQNVIMMAPAPGGNGAQGGVGSMMPTLIMFGAVILIMYFLMIRPQQKRQKEHQNMLNSLGKGDKVVTSSGMHGTIVDSDEKTFVIQIADNVKVRFEKNAIVNKAS